MRGFRSTWPKTAVFVLGVLLAAVPLPAKAIYCSNCGTEWTQLANNIELVAQLEQQVALLQQAIQQYQNLITNTTGLAEQVWGNASGDLRQLTQVLAQAQSLSFAAGNLDAQFAKKFSDYRSYETKGLTEQALGDKYQQWSAETNSSVLSSLRAAGLQAEQMEGSEEVYLRQLQGLAEGAEGRMQAIQVGNQIGITTARQLQKLRQLMLVQLQLQANYTQQQMDQDAVQTAAWRKFAAPPAPTRNPGKRY
jgi:type IV secretion system protein TrbJ